MIKSLFFLLALGKAPATPITKSTSCKDLVQFFEKKYKIPNGLLTAISYVESRHSPWVYNSRGYAYRFKNKKSAVQSLEALNSQGITNNHIGCMQINWPAHRKFFKNAYHIMTPYNNVDYAAKLLLKGYRRTKNWERAIQYYHSSPSPAGISYQRRVSLAWKRFQKPQITPVKQKKPFPKIYKTLTS